MANSATVREVKEVLAGAEHGLGLTIWYCQVRIADKFERVFADIPKWSPGMGWSIVAVR